MPRTKGAKGKSKPVETNVEPKEPKKRGRQKGSPAPQREPAVIIPLDKKHRIKWDKLNKALQEKQEKQNIQTEEDGIEEVEDGWKTIAYCDTFEYLGKCYMEEVTRKKAIKECKEGTIEINKLIEVINNTYPTIRRLFKQMDIDESKLKIGGK